MMAVAIARLSLQYDRLNHEIDYIWSSFWLFMEAAIGLIMASITPWRKILFDPQTRAMMRLGRKTGNQGSPFQLVRVEENFTGHNQQKSSVTPPLKPLSITGLAFFPDTSTSPTRENELA